MRDPDQTGRAGRAWLLRPTNAAASLGAWLVHQPEAHPWWEWWVISIVHLRDEEGLPAAQRAYPEAAYEFQIRTLDPDEQPSPDPDLCDEGWEFLDPPDVIDQFHGISDAQAEQLCMMAVRAVIDGAISPDEDFRRHWHALLRAKIAEFRAGHLPMN